MPRLIHLNGPSGIGKSTVARMYTEAHPGVLDLDTDQVVGLIGGWQANFYQTPKAARLLAISMAETHLRTGHDVVMPQLATRTEEVEGFEEAARRSGAEYREIVLLADKRHTLDRFADRVANAEQGHQRHMDEIVAHNGGSTLVERIHDHLTAFVRQRPDCVVLRTDGHTPEQAYEAVLASLGEP